MTAPRAPKPGRTEHTPGPWTVGYDDEDRPRVSGPAPDFPLIADCRNWRLRAEGFRNGVEDANARLIAAAPDLLAALEKLNRMCKHHLACRYWNGPETSCDCGKELARAAIAQAKGGAS